MNMSISSCCLSGGGAGTFRVGLGSSKDSWTSGILGVACGT